MKNGKRNDNKPVFDLDNFREVINLIPSLQQAVTMGIERELKKPKQKQKIIKMDRTFMQDSSTLLQGKWTIDILYMIFFFKNPFFNDLRRTLPEINTRTLTTRLSSLEEKGILERIVHVGKPVRVSYKMTPFGEGLTKLVFSIAIYVILEHDKNINGSAQYEQ